MGTHDLLHFPSRSHGCCLAGNSPAWRLPVLGVPVPPAGPGRSSLFSGLHLASSFSLSHLCCCSFLSTSSGPSYTLPFRQDVNTIYLLASGDLQPQEPHEVLPAPRARLSSLPWFFQLSFCQLLLLSCSCRILSWASCLLTLAFPVSGAFPVSWLMMLGRERVPVWVCVHMCVCVCVHMCVAGCYSPSQISYHLLPMPSSLSLIPAAIISCYSGPYLRTGSSAWGVWGWGCGWCSFRVLAWGPHPELPLPTHFEGFRQLLRAEQAGGRGLFPLPRGRRSLSYPLLVLTVLCLKPVWESLLKPLSGALHSFHRLSLGSRTRKAAESDARVHACVHVLCACVDTSVCVCEIAVPSQMRTSFCLMDWFWF